VPLYIAAPSTTIDPFTREGGDIPIEVREGDAKRDVLHAAGLLQSLLSCVGDLGVAEAFGIKIYAIGAGTKGRVPFPVTNPWGRTAYQNVLIELDEEILQEVADITGGKYFRATDTESLRSIYEEIDALEKIKLGTYGICEICGNHIEEERLQANPSARTDKAHMNG